MIGSDIDEADGVRHADSYGGEVFPQWPTNDVSNAAACMPSVSPTSLTNPGILHAEARMSFVSPSCHRNQSPLNYKSCMSIVSQACSTAQNISDDEAFEKLLAIPAPM